jgi:hypothetical protein
MSAGLLRQKLAALQLRAADSGADHLGPSVIVVSSTLSVFAAFRVDFRQ